MIKHEIQFVVCIFNSIRGLMNLLFAPGHIVLAEHKVNFVFVLNFTVVTYLQR